MVAELVQYFDQTLIDYNQPQEALSRENIFLKLSRITRNNSCYFFISEKRNFMECLNKIECYALK